MPEFVSWRPEPGAIATDASNIPWDFPLSYRFPPFCLIPMCLRKVIQEQVDCILIAPVWRSRPWYPAGSENPEASKDRQNSSPLLPEKIPVSCMENFRKILRNKGLPEKVSKILLSSWRSNTAKQYESAWKGWSSWFSKEKLDPFSTTIKHILSYLADLFHQGRQYRTIRVHCSAISSFHIPLEGVVVGQHQLVIKFMKGIFSLRSLEPMYFVTWDVNNVLQLLRSRSPAESLSLKKLSLKLAMLGALITASRSSSLAQLDLTFRFLSAMVFTSK